MKKIIFEIEFDDSVHDKIVRAIESQYYWDLRDERTYNRHIKKISSKIEGLNDKDNKVQSNGI